jgi:hypothetical protein
VSGPDGRQAIAFTRQEAIDIHYVSGFPVSQTWGESASMVESYNAKWLSHGMPGPPPPYGFKVFQNGRLLEMVIHLPENPLVMRGLVRRIRPP